MRRSYALLIAALSIATAAAAPAVASEDAGEVGAMHNITCRWVDVNPPWSSTSTAVEGFVQVRCSDKLDKANTQAQLQRFVNSTWSNHGDPVTSYSTGGRMSTGEYLIHVADSAAKSTGGWYYRTQGTHFGQHGNIFSLPTFYSNSRYLTRN